MAAGWGELRSTSGAEVYQRICGCIFKTEGAESHQLNENGKTVSVSSWQNATWSAQPCYELFSPKTFKLKCNQASRHNF